MKNLIIILSVFFILMQACQKIEKVDPVPEIKFKNFELENSSGDIGTYKGKLVFSFIDGDGDVGLFDYDTLNADSTLKYNLFLYPYKKIDSQYVEIDISHLEVPPFYRIGYDSKMDRVGQNKTLKGDVTLDIDYFEQKPFNSDTIRYEFYIVDRAGNQSNTEVTSDIGF